MTTWDAVLAVTLLGAFHGINPAMGWLFAVARGLQEGDRREVVRSLLPIGLGHAISVALIAVVIGVAGHLVEPSVLRVAGAVTLGGFGAYKFLRPRSHPKWVGMRVSRPELGLWSFLMSSAHGAGLMLFPVLLGTAWAGGHHGAHMVETVHHSAAMVPGVSIVQGLAVITLHGLVMVAVMGALALVIYERVGLGVLRRAWVNLDLIWAVALVGAGLATLFI